MSALDDLMARDAGSADKGGSALDQVMARDQATSDAPPSVAGAGRGSINPGSVPDSPGVLAALGGGLGHGFGETMLGAQQLIGRGLSAAGSDTVGPWLTKDAETGLASLDAQYAPLSEAHPVIAGTGNVGGQIGATMLPAAALAKVAPAYAGASAIGRGASQIGLGAAQGAAGAAMMPVNEQPDGQSYWAQKAGQVGLGAAMGATVPAVISAGTGLGKAAWSAIRPVVQPTSFVGEGLANAMSPADAALAAQNIRSAPTFVPGSMPTTAQVAQTPFMVQTEKAASNLPAVKSAMVQRAIDNTDARWAALNGVAQSPTDLAAAQAARSQTAAPLYAAAHQASAPIDNTVANVMQRPAVQQAMQQADTLAKNEGVQLTWPTPQNPTISGHALDYTNRALGDLIDTAKRSGNSQEARALTDAQSQLKTWGESNIPELSQAAQTYAQASVPVNTMEAGQQIANSLSGKALNSAGVPDIPLAGYRSAMGQALKGSQYGIDPAAESTLQGIAQDLQRQSISNSVRTPGSDTAYNIAANGWLAKNLYGPNFQGATGIGKTAGAIGALATGHPYVAAGIFGGGNKIGQMVGGRLESRLSDLLLDPNAILPYLDSRVTAPAQSIPGPLVQGLLDYGRPAIGNGILGSLVEGNRK